mgnify:CR=1 FL=1
MKDQEGFHGDISLATSETAKTLKNPKSLKTAGFMPEEDVLLEEIIGLTVFFRRATELSLKHFTTGQRKTRN